MPFFQKTKSKEGTVLKSYSIIKNQTKQGPWFIFINSTEDLYYLQSEIYDDISKSLGNKFTVIVDLLLRNGISFNRFIEITFEGDRKVRSTILNPREVSEEIKKETREYIKKHPELLAESTLTQSTINFLVGG